MAWGLEITTDMVRVCRARRRRGSTRVDRRAEAPVPAGLIRPSLKQSNITNSAALGSLLSNVCRQVGCRGWVRVALPDAVFSLRTIETDELPPARDEARRFLRWQARDLLPVPTEELRLDFLSPGRAPDGRLRVPCLMAQDRILQEYEDALAAAGLRAAVLDAHSVCVACAKPEQFDAGATGLLSASGRYTTLLLFHEGRPRFWRTLTAGAADWEEDRRAPLLREVADSLAYCRDAEGAAGLRGLFLEGWGGFTDGIARALGEWLEVPVQSLDGKAGAAWEAPLGAAARLC